MRMSCELIQSIRVDICLLGALQLTKFYPLPILIRWCVFVQRWLIPDVKKLSDTATTLAKDLERQNEILREIMKQVTCAFQSVFPMEKGR